MATVTVYTAARSLAIENSSVVTGSIVGDDLILTTRGGDTINAGDVRGPVGPIGQPGSPGSVGTETIADSAVTLIKMADNSVGTSELVDGSITLAKMGSNSVNSDQYVVGSIDRAHLAADVIDSTKLANDSVNSEHYVNGSIDREHLASDVIDSTKLANDSVNSEHYVNNSIDNAHLANDSVGYAEIIDGAIRSNHYYANSVGSSAIGANAVNISELYSTSWAALSLNGGWSNYSGRRAAQYRRVADEIQLRGTIKNSGDAYDGDSVFTLPSGYRPLDEDSYPATSTTAEGPMYFYVEPGGAGRIYGADGAVGAVALTGIRFSLSN